MENMKRSLLCLVLIYFMIVNLTSAQDPEPACACAQPEFIVELGGKLKLNYKEINICTMDDGSILLQDRDNDNYYIVKGGITQGPYGEEDPRIAGFTDCYMGSLDMDDLLQRYKGILSKSGDKFMITFGGKSYGPFIEIADFVVSRSRDKFAAVAYDKDGEMPKLITNIPNASFDIVNTPGAWMTGSIKYDEIVVMIENKILNLQGKTLYNIKPEMSGDLFINTTNTRSAYYDGDALVFSDNTVLPNLFNPHLKKTGNTVYLAYMYYSPERKAIMQCKIPF
jgi:hypothetical protein